MIQLLQRTFIEEFFVLYISGSRVKYLVFFICVGMALFAQEIIVVA